tara:strand:+ start:764 stop:889 length:126 start_codon:yes stop_codon:yes gene_type:complete
MENQGRSKRQVENNYKILEWTAYTVIGFGIIILITKTIGLW